MRASDIEHTLDGQLARASDGAVFVASMLSGIPMDGEPTWVSNLRTNLQQSLRWQDAVRREFARRGESPEGIVRGLVEPMRTLKAGDSPGSSVACGRPMMRVRLAQITAIDPDDEVLSDDEIYCLIHAESDVGAEVRLTDITAPLDDGESYPFTTDNGLVWGNEGLRDPEGRLNLTYYCVESEDNSEYQRLLSTLQDQLEEAASASGSVWLAAAGVAIAIIQEALALDDDDKLFNASQVIDYTDYLDAAPGVC